MPKHLQVPLFLSVHSVVLSLSSALKQMQLASTHCFLSAIELHPDQKMMHLLKSFLHTEDCSKQELMVWLPPSLTSKMPHV